MSTDSHDSQTDSAPDHSVDTAEPNRGGMMLKVLLPTAVVVDEMVEKVVAEGENGAFCLRPRHVDFLSAIVPGILTFTTSNGLDHYVAVGDGILVKRDNVVRVSTRHAVRGTDLGSLRSVVAEQFALIDERERVTRAAIAKLEADFVRRFLQLGEPSHV